MSVPRKADVNQLDNPTRPKAKAFRSTIVVTGTDHKPLCWVNQGPSTSGSSSFTLTTSSSSFTLTSSSTALTTLYVSYRHAVAPWALKYVITKDPDSTPPVGTVGVWMALQNPTPNEWGKKKVRVTLLDRLRKMSPIRS